MSKTAELISPSRDAVYALRVWSTEGYAARSSNGLATPQSLCETAAMDEAHVGKLWYAEARMCLNGHVLSVAVRADEPPVLFCGICGAPAIERCSNCATPIRGGTFDGELGEFWDTFELPSYCTGCGTRFPWTETILRAAQELADELDNLSPAEKVVLKGSLEDIVRDSPNTVAAQVRFRRIVGRAGNVAVEGFRQIFVDIVSEAVRKQMGL